MGDNKERKVCIYIMRCVIRNIHNVDGITESVIHGLDTDLHLEKAIILDMDNNGSEDDKIEYKPLSLAMQHNSLELEKCDAAVSRHVLDGMLPYKSMAMHLMMRESHYDIYSYHYLEEVYYKHVRYWNDLLDTERIDFVLFLVTPHHIGEYVLYALAKVKKIRVAIFTPITPVGHFVMGTSIENLGYPVEEVYKSGNLQGELNEDFAAFANRVIASSTFSAKEKIEIKTATKNTVFSFSSYPLLIRRMLKVAVVKFAGRYKEHRDFYLKEQKRLAALTFQSLKYEKEMDHIKDYQKLSKAPDWSDKYIYFALQQTPEETTMPRAGEYKNQILSIRTLAKAANKNGLKVYVKEHWVQGHRDPGFYQEINNIEGVMLVDLEVNAGDLIDHAQAVSTQTGTCIIEAMLKGKHCLFFGEGQPFKGAPGAVRIDDEIQADNVIQDILCGKNTFSREEALRYMKALELGCVRGYVDSLAEVTTQYDRDESARKIVEFIKTLF